MSTDLTVVGKVLAGRLRDVEAVVERADAFVVRAEEGIRAAGPVQAAERTAAAQDLVLRMLAVLASPSGWAVLQALSDGDRGTADLSSQLGHPRLSVWEQVNDLVQVGLVAHEFGGDRVGLTPAGLVMVELVEQLVRASSPEDSP